MNSKGLTTRRTRSRVEVLRLHYSADPERNFDWVTQERQKYSSPAAWDREQEIIHHAGGGELLFAEILNRHADKIIIRDPRFQIPPFWKRIGGFDHGKTNPTAALVVAIDTEGTIYCLAEYYQPELTPRQHMENLELLPGFLDARPIYADLQSFIKPRHSRQGSRGGARLAPSRIRNVAVLVEDIPPNQPSPQPGQQRRLLLGSLSRRAHDQEEHI